MNEYVPYYLKGMQETQCVLWRWIVIHKYKPCVCKLNAGSTLCLIMLDTNGGSCAYWAHKSVDGLKCRLLT